jgi:hypothetical protein
MHVFTGLVRQDTGLVRQDTGLVRRGWHANECQWHHKSWGWRREHARIGRHLAKRQVTPPKLQPSPRLSPALNAPREPCAEPGLPAAAEINM